MTDPTPSTVRAAVDVAKLVSLREQLETSRAAAAGHEARRVEQMALREAATLEYRKAADAIHKELRAAGVPDVLVSIDYAIHLTDAFMAGRHETHKQYAEQLAAEKLTAAAVSELPDAIDENASTGPDDV